MESKIKWQTGEPKEEGFYLVTLESGIPQSLPMRVGFIEGAKWADKTSINKAIDILIDLSNDGYLIDIHNLEEFEKQFRKIMEE